MLRSFLTNGKLRDTLARQGALLDSFSGYIYSSSPDYRIEYMNDRLIQKCEGERIGKLCFQVVFGLEEKCPWCVAERVFKGETLRQEIKHVDEERWFNVVNTPLHHSNGEISHHALFYDISSRKEAEENLRESQKKYKELYQQFQTPSHFWIWIKKWSGRIKVRPNFGAWRGRTCPENCVRKK